MTSPTASLRILKTEDIPGTIPKLQFVEAAMAEACGEEKIFLIEEWINTSEAPFIKYINNARAVSCVPQTASEDIKNIAKFLCLLSMFSTSLHLDPCLPRYVSNGIG